MPVLGKRHVSFRIFSRKGSVLAGKDGRNCVWNEQGGEGVELLRIVEKYLSFVDLRMKRGLCYYIFLKL